MSLDVCLLTKPNKYVNGGKVLFDRNITHNLAGMAGLAGVYLACWRPEEMTPPATVAEDIIPTLRQGLAELTSNPEKFEQLNPENGWGSYEGLVGFVSDYLEACMNYPEALIEVSR